MKQDELKTRCPLNYAPEICKQVREVSDEWAQKAIDRQKRIEELEAHCTCVDDDFKQRMVEHCRGCDKLADGEVRKLEAEVEKYRGLEEAVRKVINLITPAMRPEQFADLEDAVVCDLYPALAALEAK